MSNVGHQSLTLISEHATDYSDAAIGFAVVSDKSCEDSEEHAIVVGVVEEEEVRKPQEGQNVTRRAAPYKTHEDLQQDQRTAEELSMAKKRTRRSTRSKVAAAAQKGQKGEVHKFSPPLFNSDC